MKTSLVVAFACAVFSLNAFGLSAAEAQTAAVTAAAEPRVQPAVEGVLDAFKDHPIVALGDAHGVAEEGAFYNALISDRRFAREVGNVVVEFGGAAHQDVIDRYVAGEPVPYAELRRVWTDVVGWVPTVTLMEYMDFFAAVRAANAKSPPEQRIHVWLGEPAIDWSKIKTEADLQPLFPLRNQHPAEILEREILAKGKKALVIYGGGHFRTPASAGGDRSLDAQVEAAFPHSVFLVLPYEGFNEAPCSAALEARATGWPVPALVSPVKGTWLAGLLRAPGCTFLPGLPVIQVLRPPQAAQMKSGDEDASGVKADAFLYLGAADSLTLSPIDPASYLDEDYFPEIGRRFQIMTGRPLDWSDWVAGNGRGTTKLSERYGRVAHRGTETALRRVIGEFSAGQVDYDRMGPDLAALARKTLPNMHDKVSGLGAVRSIRFIGGSPPSADLYEVAQEHGVSRWMIALDDEGRIEGLRLLPNP
ncbi:MAG TPA: hypothetical protein VGM25_10345 [Caulobacteraceae bacterium]|jgi:hypothetical protein